MFTTLKEWNNGLGFWSDKFETIKNELKHIDFDSEVMYLAYTDYGGDIFDKYFIDYMIENHPDNILHEDTCYNGKNAIIYGDIVKEIKESMDGYLLGFENFEDYFSECENNDFYEGILYFLDDLNGHKLIIDRDDAVIQLSGQFSGYFNTTTQGLDYNEDTIMSWCLENDIIEEIK